MLFLAIAPSFATFTVNVFLWLVSSVADSTLAPPSPFTSTKPVMTSLPVSVILFNSLFAFLERSPSALVMLVIAVLMSVILLLPVKSILLPSIP